MERTSTRKNRKSEKYFDYSLLFIILFLIGFGLVMLYSTSSYTAATQYHDAAYWVKKQLRSTGVGVVFMLVLCFIPYSFWERFATLGMIVSIGLVIACRFFKAKNGAHRWIEIGGFSLQPAEIAKLCLILCIASLITKLGKGIRTWKGMGTVLLIGAGMAGVVLIFNSNLSTAIILFGITFIMCFVASPDYKRFLLMVGIAAVLGIVFVLVAVKFPEVLKFRADRVVAWLDPEAHAAGIGMQTMQGLYAIGSGGIWGKGLGQSMQKLGFIPEAQNDMIFSIICEELGLFGAFAIMVMFILLIWRLVIIGNNASNQFGAMFVVGVIAHISLQVLLNIGVVTNTIPNTGITLPFISYGGSAIIFLMMELGVCMNVARTIELKE